MTKILEKKAGIGGLGISCQVRSRATNKIPKITNIPNRRSCSQNKIKQPSGKSRPQKQTNFTTSPSETKSRPTLKNIGGMSEIIQELREVIELPLKHPDLLSKLGLEPSRGVLLVGPPGTGKTLTAKAIAKELKLNYMAINGPEVMSKYYGEAEAKLREIFAKAKKSAPCLVFI
ncbi:MAG: AAA family ATPase, partial [Trichodesmium sp. MAG_R04]|nr:AAA family ATPase [Trichodesmium sp. MAG_R04]